ncbi:response regulator [Marivita hallyeonensis]|uniref:Diguanylate cyclase (GGDEF) domain-containing protein n=1 Tax=Marivita hallyeonensis TaxID=996342 RepID=A0A1M5MQI7_9RHOB|nr:response regulator [Marivita hallyeonensis]SHG79467.1 diguanylate cyclase (GGDEF) domain-containing protein [Marivita hallyeonensis]
MKIFAVDDDPVVIDVLEAMLLNLGYTDIVSANDGKLALQMLSKAEDEFDCILMDISMPGLTGIELCKLLRSAPKFASVPIVMMTALADKASVDNAFRAGATDYVNKPFDIVELEMRLRMAKNLNSKRLTETETRIEHPTVSLRSINRIEPVKLDGVEDLIDYNALCNYLAHLSLAGLEARQVVALKLHDFDRISSRASEQELSYFLSEIAEVVADAYRQYDCMMAYCGDGAFIVVSDKSNLESSVSMEERIIKALKDKNIEYDDSSMLALEVSIGNPIRPNTSKSHRVRKTFDRAVARAHSRLMRKRKSKAAPAQVSGAGLRLIDPASR